MKPFEDQALRTSFLIGSTTAKASFDDTCPSAKTIQGYSRKLEQWVLIQLRCKRWGCRHCGERKIVRFGWRVLEAEPNRLVTLTINNAIWENPRAAYDGTKAKVAAFATRIRRKYNEFEYFKVLEVTKKGWPHYHLIVRSPWIPQPEMSQLWDELTGAYIVDVRKLNKTKDVYFYVVKYLGKQKYIPWTNRRVSWSRKFWKDKPFDQKQSLDLINVTFVEEHPADIIRKDYHPFRIAQYSADCWAIQTEHGAKIGRKKMRQQRKSTK